MCNDVAVISILQEPGDLFIAVNRTEPQFPSTYDP